jgi:predicted XRE-type DNA-binding protein
MSKQAFSSVWDAIADTKADAENMKLRSELMMALEQHINAQNWSQAQAARSLGITQPRISDLLRGKINLFALDTLVNLLAAAGLRVEVTVKKAA